MLGTEEGEGGRESESLTRVEADDGIEAVPSAVVAVAAVAEVL